MSKTVERGDKDQWHNVHRQGKKSFQALLPPEEARLVAEVKDLRGFKTDRELLMALCRQALERGDTES